jgi:hypothetical protein
MDAQIAIQWVDEQFEDAAKAGISSYEGSFGGVKHANRSGKNKY